MGVRLRLPEAQISKVPMLAFDSLIAMCMANSTEYWQERRDALIDEVYGNGLGVLPTKSTPDQVLTWPENPGLQGLVWNMSDPRFFEITSTGTLTARNP